jgi:hypothetical protein
MTTTPENRPHQPRRIKLINRGFQIGLMIKFLLANAAVLVLFGGVMYLFLHAEIESNLQSAHATYRTLGEMLFPIILTLSLLILAILSVTIVFVILYASHRIAGPMYRFHHALSELGNRNLKALTRIREDDQLVEISTALEAVRDRWSSDVAQLRRLAAELREQIPAGEAGEGARKNVGEIQYLLDSYTG